MLTAKQADLAGPGIGNYAELANILPNDYGTALTPKETQLALLPSRIISKNTCAKR